MLDPVIRQLMHAHIQEKTHPIEPIITGVSAVIHHIPDIRCVAFDVYGTLLVSAAGEVGTTDDLAKTPHSFISTAHRLGIPSQQVAPLAQSFYQMIRAYHHHARERGIQYPEVDVRSIWRDVMDTWDVLGSITPEEIALAHELEANPVWPMPGARSVIESLRSRGLRLAIVSNAQFYTPLILEALLGTTLDALSLHPQIWSFEIGVAKPSPVPFRALQEKLSDEGIDPGQTLYVGNDMLNDVVTSQDQGFKTVLFAGDARSLRWRNDRAEIRACTPDGVITDLTQLASIVTSQ
ncbi:MAG TPA: HAD family hydrolase [Alkalispirochaeta sp.]|nr:HAD family hydrolase [Alkalispirochaeta sp.]